MFIEELIIDGFKSYQNRTLISKFDPNFNAITGLNGSGKSNIIDAIIFVLGITNWSQLRVSSLQNLVYKHGQAGVRKASVTIVFNNNDTENSPVGYEKYEQITVTRQIVIGGRSKYLINGHNAQLERVKNLFRSVQLNIKNPHFLIMQGRITKVVNAKPIEILAMIEEAAGTKMYEDKKEGAVKTIQKKERKVNEITSILEEKITPTLENLKQQQEQYLTWVENKRDWERLEKFRIAYDYYRARNNMSGSEAEVLEFENKISDLTESRTKQQELLKKIKSKIQKLTEKKEQQMFSEIQVLEENVAEVSKQLVKHTTTFKHVAENFEAEKLLLVDLKNNFDNLEKKIRDQQVLLVEHDEKLKLLKQQRREKKEQLENLKKQFQAVSVGVAADGEGTTKTLADQLMEAKRSQTTCDTEVSSSSARISAAEKELFHAQKQAKKTDVEYKNLMEEEKELKSKLGNLEKKSRN